MIELTMRDAKKLYRAAKKSAIERGEDPPASLRRLARHHYGKRNSNAVGKLAQVLR